MADIGDVQQSEVIRITNGDEALVVDVVQDELGINRLQTSSKGSVNLSTDLSIIQEWGVNEVLDDVTYYDIYSETGVKTVSGFQLEFDDKKVYVRLEVDGIEVFDINCEKLKDILDWNQAPQPQTYVSWNDGLKVFYFTPNFPIQSQTSIKIQARSKTGQSKKYRASVIQVG